MDYRTTKELVLVVIPRRVERLLARDRRGKEVIGVDVEIRLYELDDDNQWRVEGVGVVVAGRQQRDCTRLNRSRVELVYVLDVRRLYGNRTRSYRSRVEGVGVVVPCRG